MKKISLAFLLVAAIAGCSSKSKKPEVATTPAPLPTTVEQAVNENPYRTPENKVRDQARHPIETLKFFGLQPEMTVVEISPGAGWYMEILAPYLQEKGLYIAAAPPVGDNAYLKRFKESTDAWLARHPQIKNKAQFTSLDPKADADIAPPGTADMVVTFRNVHNWMKTNDEQAVFNSFFKALKPGGTLGVVEHRAPTKGKADGSSGYVKETDVIRMAQKAGFRLVAKSEINANPKDTKDHPKGVWTLPPAFALGEQDKAKYLAIGESDRMTLKFVKPTTKK